MNLRSGSRIMMAGLLVLAMATLPVQAIAHDRRGEHEDRTASVADQRRPTPTPGRAAPPRRCVDPSGLVPLTDLGADTYQGKQGGLYPGGANSPPPVYLEAGLAAAAQVRPINGTIVLLAQGFSNVHQEFPAFQALAASDPDVNPVVVTVDGALRGQDAWQWQNPNDDAWANADQQLGAKGLSRADVQVIWFKTARIGEQFPFPTDAERLQRWTRTWVANMERAYPNLKLIYAGSRTYAGNAVTRISVEPWAYQGGFAVKWLIEERVTGAVTGPAWLGWGPYLWADGTKPRSDGLTWPCDEFDRDGVHPGPAIERKVGALLLEFFKSDPTTTPWFLRAAVEDPPAD